MQNSRGDRPSPWQILHLMVTYAIGLKLASEVVRYIPTEFLRMALRIQLILDYSRHPGSMCGALGIGFLTVSPGSAQVGELGLAVSGHCSVYHCLVFCSSGIPAYSFWCPAHVLSHVSNKTLKLNYINFKKL